MSTAAVTVREQSAGFLKELARSPGWVLLIAAGLLVYSKVVIELVADWWQNPDYSHGLLVPFAIAYLLYEKRNLLAEIPLRPSWFGFVLVVGSQCINLVGFLGAEYFLQRTSLVFLIAGLVLFFAGWRQL